VLSASSARTGIADKSFAGGVAFFFDFLPAFFTPNKMFWPQCACAFSWR